MKNRFYLFLFFVLLPLPLFAGTTGKIVGTVKDASNGQPLPGVNILLEGTQMGAATDTRGYFSVINVPPGRYTLVARMIGYTTTRITDVRVRVDLTTHVPIELSPTVLKLGKSVTITAERPMIQKDITSAQSIVDARDIEQMPVESVSQVLELQAGFVRSPGGALHVRGGRSGEVAYMVDGVSITDPYGASPAITVEKNAIQELQVVSGTFNAEYGQAMSGIVNIVTKEGSRKFNGSLSYYLGDYLSNHKKTFAHIDAVNPLSIQDGEFTLSGPVPLSGKKITFYASGRYFKNEGYLYGIRRFLPSDSSFFDSPDTSKWRIQESGDGAWVPMNPFTKFSGQFKLSYRISPSLKLTYVGFVNTNRYQSYSHKFKLDPDGNLHRFSDRFTNILTLNQMLTPNTFYSFKYSNFSNSYRHYVYKNPLDSRYVSPARFYSSTGYRFYTGGQNMNHFYRNTLTHVFKFELTSQINKAHQVKTGFEYRWNRLYYEAFRIRLDWQTGWKPQIPGFDSPSHNRYVHHPTEFAYFVQDKIELRDMIVNLGIRYERFNPNGQVLADPRDPNINRPLKPEHQNDSLEKRRSYWYKSATPKTQISPRIGIAYPITDQGVIHFSYGHFLQIPPYAYLYSNPDFEVTGGLSSLIGNANLEPQRTVSYEIGLQQQLTQNIAIDVTGYYKDVRNLLGTQIIETYAGGDRYALYVNRDYGNIRGITLTLRKRYSNYLSGQLDYTYGVAEGNASDPNSVFYDVASGREPEKQLVYLSWDQTHTLNGSVTLSVPQKWGVSLIGQYGSGLPYTPTYQGQRTSFENSERKPMTFNVDLRAHYDLKIKQLRTSLFLLVYNLFDRKNELLVYTDTGRATYTLVPQYTGDYAFPNSLAEYLIRPDYFSAPREIKTGVVVYF